MSTTNITQRTRRGWECGSLFFFSFQFVSHQSSQLVWWMSDKREGGRFCNCNWKCWKVPKRSSARKATAEKQQAKQLKKNRKQRWNNVKTKKKMFCLYFCLILGGFSLISNRISLSLSQSQSTPKHWSFSFLHSYFIQTRKNRKIKRKTQTPLFSIIFTPLLTSLSSSAI